jgi:hypothetical protein
MDEKFKDALDAYRMVIETTIDTFNKRRLGMDASHPQVLAKTIDAAEQAMWLVMDGGVRGVEEDGGKDD